MLDSLSLIKEFVALPGPPGAEGPIRAAVESHVRALGFEARTDPKGNLLVPLGAGAAEATPRVVVTAHLDEIALMVQRVDPDGRLRVTPLGGILPWKWGEQPVAILAGSGMITGIVSYGSIHSASPASVTQQARTGPLGWDQARIFTGLSPYALEERGVRPGTRVVLHPERRTVTEVGRFVCSYFLDDRADLVAMLLALEMLKETTPAAPVLFAATVAEEVGGEGAQYLLHRIQPEVCIALEIGPSVPESPFMPDEQPTIWATDNFASSTADDLDMIAAVCEEIGQRPHWQALSRGGSDASCSAARGLVARPITLGLPVENSHGCEIMHRDAPAELARLTVAYIKRITEPAKSKEKE